MLTAFGQTAFGHFSVSVFWPNFQVLVPVGACWCLLVLVGGVCCVCVVGVSRFLGLSPGPPSAGPPISWTTQNFALFFSLPPEIAFFLSLGSSRGILVVFLKRRGWALGLRVKPRRFPGPPGLHTTTRELQTCTFERPSASKHHHNSTRRPPERNKKSEIVAG